MLVAEQCLASSPLGWQMGVTPRDMCGPEGRSSWSARGRRCLHRLCVVAPLGAHCWLHDLTKQLSRSAEWHSRVFFGRAVPEKGLFGVVASAEPAQATRFTKKRKSQKLR